MSEKAKFIAAVDLGTTYLKAAIVGRDGTPLSLVRKMVSYDRYADTRCELDTAGFLSGTASAVREAVAAAGIDPSCVEGFSYSSQANTFTLLDADGESLIPFISWQDRRVDEAAPELVELWGSPEFLETTGLGLSSNGSSVAKYRWIVEHSPEIARRTRRLMNVSDYLVYSLTGEAKGDAGTAALLGLLDVRRVAWWDAAVRAAGLEPWMLCEPARPGTVVGAVTKTAAAQFGIPSGIPVVAGSLDHHAAGVGAGVPVLAPVSESTGTVIACLSIDESYSPREGCCIGPASLPGSYYHLAFHSEGGTLLERYRAERTPHLSFADLDALVERDDLSGDELTIAGEARAIMTDTATKLAGLVSTLRAGRAPERIVATGGGAKSRPWLQIKADLMNTEMVVPIVDEPACRGAAIFAAGAIGWFSDSVVSPPEWHRIKLRVGPADPVTG